MLFPVAGPDHPDSPEQRATAVPTEATDAVARGAAGVTMRDLLASCAAARAVSVPPSAERDVTGGRAAREAA